MSAERATVRHVLLLLAAVVVVQAVAVLVVLPPSPVPADGDPARPSAARVWPLLRDIARAPRPPGSDENAHVRGLLARELANLGLDVQMQEGRLGDAPSVPLTNVTARRRGTGDGGALLLLAHHDSVASGPGAGDDGAGVAAILEALAVTAHDPLPSHDVMVLFSDGEEAGLLGARLFAQAHPWREDVLAVVNIEGRGNAGPSTLFETGPGSGALVRAYARGASSAFGDSLGPAVYARMPNDTDFSVFRRAGLPGLNFAFFAGASVYHRERDTVDALSAASVQHHAENLVGVLRGLADVDLRAPPPPDVRFSVLPGLGMVTWPAWAPVSVWILACVALGVRGVRGARAGHLRPWRVAAGFGVELAALPLGVAAAVGTGWLGARAAAVVPAEASSGDMASALWLSLGAGGIVLAVRLSCARLAGRMGLRAAESTEGGLVLLALLGAASAVWLPEAMLLPAGLLLFGCLAASLPGSVDAESGPNRWTVTMALVGLLLVLPLQHVLAWVGSVAEAGAVLLAASLAALGQPVLGAPRDRLAAPVQSRGAVLVGLLGIGCIAIGRILERLGA